MKIGAGGLQSLAQFEAVARRVEAGERPGVARQELEPNTLRQDLAALIRAVERLNELAKLFNQNTRFRVRRKEGERKQDDDGHDRMVEVVDLVTGKVVREMEPGEVAAFEHRLAGKTGLIIDSSQ